MYATEEGEAENYLLLAVGDQEKFPQEVDSKLWLEG